MTKKRQAAPRLALDYYTVVFHGLFTELELSGYEYGSPPAVRSSYWLVVPPGHYGTTAGLDLVQGYAVRVEEELKAMVAPQSLAYWLHVYRRLAPRLPGQSPATVM
ncbi:MAG TPA: hypothetical protein VGK32_15070 [Vicinamibacterales bacterium]|jgi:hypothetical protein